VPERPNRRQNGLGRVSVAAVANRAQHAFYADEMFGSIASLPGARHLRAVLLDPDAADALPVDASD